MLAKVISGGQTGADQAALRAAKAARIRTDGLAPRGYRTEAGVARWLKRDFGLDESVSDDYKDRTRWNVEESDASLIFSAGKSPGTDLTIRFCERLKKDYRVVMLARYGKKLCPATIAHHPEGIADWIQDNAIATLNVAGHRESVCPGIGEMVERYMAAVFAALMAQK